MRVQGHKVYGGTATGPVAKSSIPLSFLGEIDPLTGRVDNASSELNGRTLGGTVLAFPEARGSTVGPYVIYGAGTRGVGPVALVVERADAIVVSAAVIARIPCVEGVDMDLLMDGETVQVDGDKGTVELPRVKETPVVTAFLQREDGRVLLLKRSQKVGSFRGRWAGVSGYLETPKPEEQGLREIEEETGIARSEVQWVRSGPPVLARDSDQIFVVHPMLFQTRSPSVRIDWEHTEFEWVDPQEIHRRETVPKLDRAWNAVREDGRGVEGRLPA
jgi:predicted aconitase with swiveling domain/8-oxo-dGTP pyrophosphatase MutT (NUDIX family)